MGRPKKAVKVIDASVDLQDLCQKLQSALAKSYVDIEQLQLRHNDAIVGIARQEVIIQYLESKFK